METGPTRYMVRVVYFGNARHGHVIKTASLPVLLAFGIDYAAYSASIVVAS